jgi:hypothetical protein
MSAKEIKLDFLIEFDIFDVRFVMCVNYNIFETGGRCPPYRERIPVYGKK